MQKTAYEMRISDWSSDVCSSDLESLVLELRDLLAARGDGAAGFLARLVDYDRRNGAQLVNTLAAWLDSFGDVPAAAAATFLHPNRSEERRVGNEGVRTCRARWYPYH